MPIIETTSSNRWFWPVALTFVTLFALALRWYYVSTAVVLDPVRGDATQYFSYAWNLVHHGTFAKNSPGSAVIIPDNYRDPGYPLLLALWMRAYGAGDEWYAAVLLCQALLGALTVTLTTALARHWLPPMWAICTGLLIAIWPHCIAINAYLLTETLFAFLSALAMLLWARACQLQSLSWAAAAGTIFGAAALTNAVLLPFALLLAAFLGWSRLAPRKLCIVLAAGALALPGGWAIRNSQITRSESSDSSTDRALQNLVQGAWPTYHSAWRASLLGDPAERTRGRLTLKAIDAEYTLLEDSPKVGAKAILHRLAQHPMNYATWYLFRKPYQLWGWEIQIGQGDIYVYPTRNAPFQRNRVWIALESICRAANPLLMLLAFASLFVAWKRRNPIVSAQFAPLIPPSLVSVMCLLVFATLVYTGLQAEPRYSIAFRPFEILLAFTSLHCLTAWLRKRAHAGSPAPTSGSCKSIDGDSR